MSAPAPTEDAPADIPAEPKPPFSAETAPINQEPERFLVDASSEEPHDHLESPFFEEDEKDGSPRNTPKWPDMPPEKPRHERPKWIRPNYIACSALFLASVVCFSTGIHLFTQSSSAAETTPLPTVEAVATDGAIANTRTFQYNMTTTTSDSYVTLETALFNEQDVLTQSTLTVTLPNEEAASVYLERTKLLFGDAMLEGNKTGATVTYVIETSEGEWTKDSYTALLESSMNDFRIIDG